MGNYKAAIFDLDGVLVDTAKFHFFAWKELADSINIEFTLQDNERLKGVSRMASLEILISLDKTGKTYTENEKNKMAFEKNIKYVSYINNMTENDLLPGSKKLLDWLKNNNIKISLGSASKNAPLILNKINIEHYFDAIIDGNSVAKAKPDPEVFMLAAKKLNINPNMCIVFEDSDAGIVAAKAANMFAVGIGKRHNLPMADVVYNDLSEFEFNKYF